MNPKDARRKEDVKNSKVALYMNMASMSPPIELHAGLVRDLLSRNNNVTVYVCDRSFKSPTENPFNSKFIYNFSRFRARDAVKGLQVKTKVVNLNGEGNEVNEKTADSLEIAVMSSLASATKAQNKEQLNEKWRRVYYDMLESAKRLYNYFGKEIEMEKYDFVFLFNGRFGCAKPVLDAARDSGTAFGLNEVKKSTHEIVFINQLIHSIDGNTERAIAFYEKDPKRAEENAEKFFTKKTKNEATGDPIYTKNQAQGELPEEIADTDKTVVAIYPSTEDEYKFIGKEWDGFVPESQIEEIDKLAENLDPERYVLVVKMHPNQATTAENTQQLYHDLAEKYSHVVVEPPLSKKDTYALMKRADVVLTFASTIGVEACYAGKPVVLIGDTNWSKMNVAYGSRSGKEAADLIKDGLEAKPKKGAIMWGNYIYAYKDYLRGYKRVANGDYYVDGRRIGKSTWRRILQLPAKWKIETSKPGFKLGKAFLNRIKGVAKNIITGKWAVN